MSSSKACYHYNGSLIDCSLEETFFVAFCRFQSLFSEVLIRFLHQFCPSSVYLPLILPMNKATFLVAHSLQSLVHFTILVPAQMQIQLNWSFNIFPKWKTHSNCRAECRVSTEQIQYNRRINCIRLAWYPLQALIMINSRLWNYYHKSTNRLIAEKIWLQSTWRLSRPEYQCGYFNKISVVFIRKSLRYLLSVCVCFQ